NLAGRDVNVYKLYPNNHGDRVDITALLGAIRNLRTIHQDILSKATPGTGLWFFKTRKYLIWVDLNGHIRILWGTGIRDSPDTLLQVYRHSGFRSPCCCMQAARIRFCYVYIRYSDRAELTVRNMLEILVKQTVERHPKCALLAEATYTQRLREKTQPTEAELLQLLRKFTEATEATFYVLDALDEALDRHQVDLIQKLASLNVRLFITSRPLPKVVEARVPSARCFPIVAREGDLDLRITQEIARSRNLADLLENADPSLRDEIVSLVKSKCGGMFLHASLQLDALCQCVTVQEVRETLEAFPLTIEDIYQQTWDRILEQRPSLVLIAESTLTWVLNASRSMTIEEMERAVAISPETFKFEPDHRAPGTTLIALCCGLVALEEESRLVRLVHYAAGDTLQTLLRGSFPHPQSHLALVCMNHLAECGFQNATTQSANQFPRTPPPPHPPPPLAYASDAWAIHARESLDVEDTRRRIASFVCESNAFPGFTSPNHLAYFDILSPLHLLATHNLPISLIPYDKIVDPNVATRILRDSPLMLASSHGHVEAVKSFLAHSKMQVNMVNAESWSALMLASRNGHQEAVKLLLARFQTQVNRFDNNGRSSLMWAA
ncbi:hypothetical protein BKA70DRAFT_1100005, partial [Coprinopsis sp. MPI-PUGE-AT-0042]